MTRGAAHAVRREAWNAVWTQGLLQACAGSWDGNYGGAIRGFWESQLATLKPTQRVLDLATGNGALPALLLELGGPGWSPPEIDAVDLADPQPAWLEVQSPAIRERIRFRGNVTLEALPFPDRQFDRIVSQFGFEYADRRSAVRESARVLADDGRLLLVCHHAGSVLAEVAQGEREDIDWLTTESGLPEALRGVLPHAQRRAQTQDAAAARQQLNAVLQDVEQRARRRAVPDLLYESATRAVSLVRDAVTGAGSDPELALGAWMRDLALHRLRLDELISHALDATDIQALSDAFTEHGLSSSSAVALRDGPKVLAWALTYAR